MSNYVRFPLESLPAAMRQFVAETAAAMGCDPAFVALPALSAAAASIGTTRVIGLKGGWTEPAIVWTAVVAPSGAMKTPPFDAAVAPLWAAQTDMMAQHDAAMIDYKCRKMTYERDLSRWRKSKTGEPPEEPPPPICPRIIVSDATVESLAPILQHNPRGLVLARDELGGWVRSFNQFKGGKGSDLQNWLELSRAGRLMLDRKTGDHRTIIVHRAAVSVCGTIQPGVLSRALTAEYVESGFAARLLLACPPVRNKEWSERSPTQTTVDGYSAMLTALLRLTHVDGPRGPEPMRLSLAADARPIWVEFYNRHAQRTGEAESEREAAALAKLEAYAARFALIFALADNPHTTEVSADAMRRGVALAEWFAHEAKRVYARLSESDETRELRELIEWIGRKGGAVTVRELQRGRSAAYPTSDEAEAALVGLVTAGLGHWESVDREGGGHIPRRFVLTVAGTLPNDTCPDLLRNTPQTSVSQVSADAEVKPPIDASNPNDWGTA